MGETSEVINSDSKSATSKLQIVWVNVLFFIVYHVTAVVGFYYLFTCQVKLKTFIWASILGLMSGQGTTAGAHRLWSHRSYKAKLPLRIFLCFCQTMAFQNHVIEWCRDHRLHHKFTETNADPYNATRGFFFSHMGWLMVRKHPDIKTKGSTVDMSDLESDPVLNFQKKYYTILGPLFSFVIPSVVPIWCWNEDVMVSVAIAAIARYIYSLHCTWLVNSAAHLWGMKPYDRFIQPADNPMVSFFSFGEGWHNYHHTFPWDYKTGELDKYSGNLTTAFIDFMGKIGWAYDMKSVPKDVVERRIIKTGNPESWEKHYQKRSKTIYTL